MSSIPASSPAVDGFREDAIYGLYELYDLAHVAGWEPYSLHDLGRTYFLGWICINYYVQIILHSLPQRQVRS